MSRQKIAPNLSLLAVECVEHIYGDAAGKTVRAELRALLAVARAGQREQDEARKVWGDDYEKARSGEPAWGEMDRALSRLSRVSRVPGAGRGRRSSQGEG